VSETNVEREREFERESLLVNSPFTETGFRIKYRTNESRRGSHRTKSRRENDHHYVEKNLNGLNPKLYYEVEYQMNRRFKQKYNLLHSCLKSTPPCEIVYVKWVGTSGPPSQLVGKPYFLDGINT